jgi:hypothetical protein
MWCTCTPKSPRCPDPQLREKWKWIELLDEPMAAVAKRRMLTVVEGSGTSR